MTRLIHLFLVFSLLSVLAVGGGTAVLPEMQHMTVHTFHWLTDAQFRNIYSLGQVAPGPTVTAGRRGCLRWLAQVDHLVAPGHTSSSSDSLARKASSTPST